MALMNTKELIHPIWLTEDYFQDVLRSYRRDSTLKVKTVTISPGTGKTDHYASVMYRVNVEYYTKVVNDQQSIRLILKTMPFIDGAHKDLIEKLDIFEREIDVYSNVLPRMTRMLNEAGVDFNAGAKCIYHSLKPHKVLIFEDMKYDDYVMRKVPMSSMESLDFLIKKIAQWHAASFVMHHNGYNLSRFNTGVFSRNTGIPLDNFEHQLSCFADVVGTWPNYEKYVPYIHRLGKNFRENLWDVYVPSQDRWNVLNHGDFHINNLLFKFHDNLLKDIAFLDFQFCLWGTPAIDLIYALLDCDFQFFETHEDEIIRKYYDEYVRTLRSLGYYKIPPTLLQLRMDMLKSGPLWAFFMFVLHPLLFLEEAQLSLDDMMDMTSESAIKKRRLYNSPALTRNMKRALRHAVNRGYLTL